MVDPRTFSTSLVETAYPGAASCSLRAASLSNVSSLDEDGVIALSGFVAADDHVRFAAVIATRLHPYLPRLPAEARWRSILSYRWQA
jgi:hypothetical protein